MIRVGVETSAATFSSAGTARYALQLINELQQLQSHNLEIVELKFGRRHQFAAAGWRRKLAYLYWERVYCKILLQRQIDRQKIDILHATTPLPFPSEVFKKKTKIVTTIMDLIAFSNPEWFTPTGARRTQQDISRSVNVSNHLIAISRTTKEAIITQFGMPENRITVTYLGSPTLVEPVSDNIRKQPFIMAVGTLEPRKNLASVLRAYGYLKQLVAHPPKLVLVGRKGWGDLSLERIIEENNLGKEVEILGFVTEQELAMLYTAAEALVYPTLSEGFGLPVLEAMTYGCPVITSNLSSLPEIVDDAAMLINPYDSQELCMAMHRLLQDAEYRRSLVRRGLGRAALFSWKTCAAETVKVYSNL